MGSAKAELSHLLQVACHDAKQYQRLRTFLAATKSFNAMPVFCRYCNAPLEMDYEESSLSAFCKGCSMRRQLLARSIFSSRIVRRSHNGKYVLSIGSRLQSDIQIQKTGATFTF